MKVSGFPIGVLVFALLGATPGASDAQGERLRLIIETDAGGDPDDEQSLVRFLLRSDEWDVEGIIANRPQARDGENKNPERTGLGIAIDIRGNATPRAWFVAPRVRESRTIHVVLAVTDSGSPPLTRYQRRVITVAPDTARKP